MSRIYLLIYSVTVSFCIYLSNGSLTYVNDKAYENNSNRISIISSISPEFLNDAINSQLLDTFEVKNIYAIGRIPVRRGFPDTLIFRLKKNVSGLIPVKLRVRKKNRQNDSTVYDTSYTIIQNGMFDSLIYRDLPTISAPRQDLIIVEALPGEVFSDLGNEHMFYSSAEYCQDITTDTFNYADPCLNNDGGIGFDNQTGNLLAGFRNKDTSAFNIRKIIYSFFDLPGAGCRPYNIVIYNDNGSGIPGSLLYISSPLISPPGTGSTFAVTHEVIPSVNISPGNKFYIGYRQTSVDNLAASYQNENPVRPNSFFYSFPQSSASWIDFSDSAKNFRLDIAVTSVTGALNLTVIPEAFYNSTANSLRMKDTISVYLAQSNSPYSIIDSAKGMIDSLNFSNRFVLSNAYSGEYYIAVKHRNCITTWSSVILSYSLGETISFDFTKISELAYGSNVVRVDDSPLKFAIYGGDVNQDGVIDGTDLSLIENDALNFASGYIACDVNGDNFVDGTDALLCGKNALNFISVNTP